MALKTLMLRKKIDDCKKLLENARSKSEGFAKREAELEAAIEEAQTEEEKNAVEEEIAKFEQEKSENYSNVSKLEKNLQELEGELAQEENKQEQTKDVPEKEEREEKKTMPAAKRSKFFGMSIQERDAFMAREDVKSFIERVKEVITEKRSVTGAALLIPTVVLSLIREQVEMFSKLYRYVNVKPVPGKARQNVMGVIPEAVWTEMCGKLNELNLSFTGVEVDGYKVGGFVPICNALLEDSDVDLAYEIIAAIGQGIGIALDKAILFGTGTKMPIGIFTRLAQTEDPEDTRTTIPWADLHTSNILVTNATGANLFAALVMDAAAAKGKYSRGGRFWAMNERTKAYITSQAVTFNAAGAIVSGASNTMPIVGGDIVELEFIPDYVIIGGYGDLYLLAERAGAEFAESEHARFTDDETVFKGTARYDGLPVIAEGFVAIGVNNVTPSATGVTFANDTANP